MVLRDIWGHATPRRLVAAAVERGTLPPSLVFSGPDGVGKRQVALALAALVNCEAPTDGDRQVYSDACGECGTCGRIARGVHADVILVEYGDTGRIPIDAIRAVVEQASFRPFEGRRRVVVIDDADRLVVEAQNALLKTLEEPPDASVFVLVTSRPHMLLPTVRSRCPELRFGGLPTSDIVDLLVERHEFKSAEAREAAGLADGSVARALEIGSGEQLRVRDVALALLRGLASAPDPKRRLRVGKDLVVARPGARSSAAADRETLTRRLRAIGTLLRDLQVVSSRGETAWLSNTDLEGELDDLVRSYDAGRAQRGFVSVDRAERALTRNASAKVVVDWLALRL